ncbi:MAG: S1/P1 nuclease [Flavobacteriia bacterium]|nr:S1/P1 nuclease [Flavobacteriia bacterium]OIP45087.1 MAG: S1/P1 Nuclease [Flavobacteriaceae bacterium CG2_30_31_66]PIV95282.1 MAG: S1/P1 Nuclease [Flavobacteriaceae bacterium CG17_big_fil_post_rev_8_21_14_2_50_31_13]PIX13114.1 MAG: S1/P1 Nuclease [Flavobacteriaceae bacterium CG_4_8_14_3_um_filter_31_8]PIY13613.1 MAG: S1/P1 Nuclease [Flavobacteriaceae bacterium CG_4_10_14_3_um_filter_31_253]PIZ11826.1 MAG: S1/P1 Nuclease [Flavobacteriaceae bacterium CG_4_10_14_0_8_um_filter_31_99]PJC08979.1 
MYLKLILLIPFFLLTKSTHEDDFFWGQNGHRATGKIAENYLTKKAKRNIDKLLKGKSLALVSTYADEIKSDRKYNSYSVWHYVNMGLEESYEVSEKNPEGDLVVGIDTCIKVLRNDKSTEEDKVFHLKMLIHLIGDLHQPMHIGRKEDKGGNDIQVQWFGQGTNLHSVWDTKMIEDYNMGYLELAANADHLSKIQVTSLQKGTVIDWVNEVHVATNEVYKSVKVGEKLSYRYSYLYLETVRTQLQKGGIRLAKVLNEIFG